jgi:hypothetical protein
MMVLTMPAQAVKLITCIPEVTGSNLSQAIDYPDEGSSYFPQSLLANAGI